MMGTYEIKVGQKESFHVDGIPVELEITGLSVYDVTFMLTGDGVKDPDKPREMPVGSFVAWLKMMAIAREAGKG